MSGGLVKHFFGLAKTCKLTDNLGKLRIKCENYLELTKANQFSDSPFFKLQTSNFKLILAELGSAFEKMIDQVNYVTNCYFAITISVPSLHESGSGSSLKQIIDKEDNV